MFDLVRRKRARGTRLKSVLNRIEPSGKINRRTRRARPWSAVAFMAAGKLIRPGRACSRGRFPSDRVSEIKHAGKSLSWLGGVRRVNDAETVDEFTGGTARV